MITTQKPSIHVKQPDYNFNKYARFTLIEQINNTINSGRHTVKARLKRREDFWILKHDTVAPKWFNQ